MKEVIFPSIALIALCLPAAAQDAACRGEPIKLTFSYSEEAPKPRNDACKGGMVGAVCRVGEAIANAGPPPRVGATYTALVRPVVEQLDDGSRRVRLEVETPDFAADANLPADKRNRAERERRLLEANLKRFETVLPAQASGGGANASGGKPTLPVWRDGEMIQLPFEPKQLAERRVIPREALAAFRSGRLSDIAGGRVIDLVHRLPAGEGATAAPNAPRDNSTSAESGAPGESMPLPIPKLSLLKPEGSPNVELCSPGGGRGIVGALAGDLPDGVSMELVPGENPGEYIARFRLPDGTVAESEIVRFTDENGAEVVAEMNPHGDMRESRSWPDGTLATERTSPDGSKEVTTLSPEGKLDQLEIGPDGGFAHRSFGPDGSITTEYRDPQGGLIETVTQRPDGWIERVGNAGNVSATFTDDNGTRVVETDRSGNTLSARFDREGNLLEVDRHEALPSEPGRAYFERDLGGRDWDQLPEHLKRRYANHERDREQMLLNRAHEDARAARERHNAAQREAASAKLGKETDRKLAAIAAEQAEADKRAAERQARFDRRKAIEDSRQKARDLQHDYDRAASRGDTAEMRRIMAEQDRHHEASHELLQPDAEEMRAIEQATGLRQRLASEVYSKAADAAAEQIARNERRQDYQDAITRGTQLISTGSEMQQETRRTTRAADRELAMARAKQDVIQKRLGDPSLPRAEREVLEDMLASSRIQEDGAARMLTDNGRITAAGYLIDAAQTATGAKVITGAARVGGRVVAQAAGRVAATGAAETAGQAATRAAASLAQNGMRALNVVGLDDAVAAAGKGAVRAAEGVGRGLMTDISTPIMSRVSKGLDSAARSVMADESVDAARDFLSRSADVLTSNVTDLPGKFRRSVDPASASRVVEGATDAARKTASSLQDGARHADARPAPVDGKGLEDTVRMRPERSPAEMTVKERQAFNDARAREALSRISPERRRNWYDADRVVEDDVLPGPMAPGRGPAFTKAEIEYLHRPGHNYTGPEIQRKGELYRQRLDAGRAVNEAIDQRLPTAEVQSRLRRYNQLRDAIDEARGARAAQSRSTAISPTDTRPSVRSSPETGPTGTQIIPDRNANRVARPQPDANRTERIVRPSPDAGPRGTQRLPDQDVNRVVRTQPDFKAQDEIGTIIDNPGRLANRTERIAPPTPETGPTGTQIIPDRNANRVARPQPDANRTERIARPTPDAGPTGTQRLPDQNANRVARQRPDAGPSGTQRLPDRALDRAATQPRGNKELYWDPTMGIEAKRDFARNPRVRTQLDFGQLEHFGRSVPHLRSDAAVRRAEWLSMPGSARRAAHESMLEAIDQAAAMGDKWARRLQTDINNGQFQFKYEPGLEYEGLALGDRQAIINPLKNGKLLTGEELASTLLHEYVHGYVGPEKWAALNKPGFDGARERGRYNEIRAFLAEGIFNRNLAAARELTGGKLESRAADSINELLSTGPLPEGTSAYRRGRRALESMQEALLSGPYGSEIYPEPKLAAINLSMYRGGSRENIGKLIRERLQHAPEDDATAMKLILDAIAADGGGQFLRQP